MVELWGLTIRANVIDSRSTHEDVAGYQTVCGLIGNDFRNLYPAATLSGPPLGLSPS